MTDRKYIVFWAEKMAPIALALHQQDPERFTLGEITWQHFKDGTPNLFIKDVAKTENRHILFLACFDKAIKRMDQMYVIKSLCKRLIKSMTILLPFYPTGTMERDDKLGQVVTADIDAHDFSTLPRPNYINKLVIYDLHTKHNEYYFNTNVTAKIASAMPIFINRLKTHHSDQQITIVFPDDGAYKRFKDFFHDYPLATCHKTRNGDDRIVTIREGEILNRDVFIVDDLVQTGGTLMECKAALVKAGARSINIFVTHAIFPEKSWEKFMDAGIGVFYCTDSFPIASKINDQGPFKVLSLYPNILDWI